MNNLLLDDSLVEKQGESIGFWKNLFFRAVLMGITIEVWWIVFLQFELENGGARSFVVQGLFTIPVCILLGYRWPRKYATQNGIIAGLVVLIIIGIIDLALNPSYILELYSRIIGKFFNFF